MVKCTSHENLDPLDPRDNFFGTHQSILDPNLDPPIILKSGKNIFRDPRGPSFHDLYV